MDNIIRVNLCYPWDMILPQISQIPTDIAMGMIIRVNLCYPWDMICHADFADDATVTTELTSVRWLYDSAFISKELGLQYADLRL